MASVTYYALLPFVRDEDGNLCPDEAVECQSSAGAAGRARALAAVKAGAVAFSRTGHPRSVNGPTPSSSRGLVTPRPTSNSPAGSALTAS